MRNNARHPSPLLNPRAGLASVGASATLNLAPTDPAPGSSRPSFKAFSRGADRTLTIDIRIERELGRHLVVPVSDGPQ